MEHLTFPEVEALPRTTPVLIPLGSVEEHGPHLPLATDVYTIYAVAKKAAEKTPILVAPPLYYGLCRSTADHPGTLSLRGLTLRALVLDLLQAFRKQGFQRFMLLSGHAGGTHMAFILDAAEEFLTSFPGVSIAVASIIDLLKQGPGELVETPNDSHAGEWETALIQYLYPEQVKGLAEEAYPQFPPLKVVRDKRAYWPSGVWGDPAKASPEKGKLLLERLAEQVVKLALSLGKEESQ